MQEQYVMPIKTLINLEKESARGRNQRKYLSTTQKKKTIIENQTQLLRGLEKLTKKKHNTKRVGRRQINKSLYNNFNKQYVPVNITHLLKIH